MERLFSRREAVNYFQKILSECKEVLPDVKKFDKKSYMLYTRKLKHIEKEIKLLMDRYVSSYDLNLRINEVGEESIYACMLFFILSNGKLLVEEIFESEESERLYALLKEQLPIETDAAGNLYDLCDYKLEEFAKALKSADVEL